jgi:hypothetical protein
MELLIKAYTIYESCTMPIQDNITTTKRMFSPILYFYYFNFILLAETGNTYARFQILVAGIMTSTVF